MKPKYEWTTGHVARELNVCRQTVRRYVRDGIIPGARRLPGGGLRFDPARVRAWIRSLEEDGTDE